MAFSMMTASKVEAGKTIAVGESYRHKFGRVLIVTARNSRKPSRRATRSISRWAARAHILTRRAAA